MKLSQARSRQTQDQILATARALFAEQGFDQTSIEQVASRAGVAKASVFAHFGDKTNLLAALGMARMDELMAESRAIATEAAKRPPAEHMFLLYEPWLAYFGEEPAFARLYLSQSGLSSGAWTERFVGICHQFERLVAEVVGDRVPGCAEERAVLLSRGLQALFHEVIVYRISGWVDGHAGAATMLRQFVTVWMAGAGAGH